MNTPSSNSLKESRLIDAKFFQNSHATFDKF